MSGQQEFQITTSDGRLSGMFTEEKLKTILLGDGGVPATVASKPKHEVKVTKWKKRVINATAKIAVGATVFLAPMYLAESAARSSCESGPAQSVMCLGLKPGVDALMNNPIGSAVMAAFDLVEQISGEKK